MKRIKGRRGCCIVYNLKYIFFCQWKYYAILCIIVLLSSLKYYSICNGLLIKPNLGDYLFWNFRGMDIIKQNGMFVVPDIYWVLLYLYLAYIIGYFPIQDMNNVGRLILIKSEKRSTWWTGKLIWCIASVVLYYAIMIITIILVGLFLGSTSLMPQNEISIILYKGMGQPSTIQQFIFICILVPLIVSIAISLFQMTICVIINPVIGYILVVTYLVCSIYIYNQFILGNFLMQLRSNYFLNNRILMPQSAIIISGLIIVISIWGGYYIFKKKDILQRK